MGGNFLESLDINKLDETINNAVCYLKNNQKKDGSVMLNNDSRWQVWETANSLLGVIDSREKEKKFIDKTLNFLLKAQRKDGSFSYTLSYDIDNYCMETTSTCLLVLEKLKQDTTKCINFILNKQNKDGSWEIGIPDMIKHRFWPSITGHVLNSLLSLNISNENISKGFDYLFQKQLTDGSWGSSWIYYDTPYYSTYVILPALKLYGLENDKRFKNCIKFIEKNQNKDGSWCMDTTDKPRPSKSLRTSLALNSLLVSPRNLNKNIINNGIKWLLNDQRTDGSWDGGYFVNWPEKKEDILATSYAIRSISKFRESFF
ncbi:hypothetical protein AYK20_05355 [Thermoplasmatales archaeon SG8-52-1]|nr:MAG: hypothetical protein AYK20_05355 [Thermoplasmatales archaeon SG8-52-1]